jgi:hypothetical protein
VCAPVGVDVDVDVVVVVVVDDDAAATAAAIREGILLHHIIELHIIAICGSMKYKGIGG